MKTRRLAISPELWIGILQGRPQHFRAVKNALPEDAKVVGVDWSRPPGDDAPITLYLLIQSSVFQESDPDELPLVHLELISSL